jgi:hypothetical protein
MDKCLNCGKRFRHYTIYFKPDPMFTKMYEFIPITMCAWCRHNISEKLNKKKLLDLEYYLFSEFQTSHI